MLDRAALIRVVLPPLDIKYSHFMQLKTKESTTSLIKSISYNEALGNLNEKVESWIIVKWIVGLLVRSWVLG